MKTTRRELRRIIREVLSTTESASELHSGLSDQNLGDPIPPEELHDALSGAIWDLYKYVNGIRPRWIDFKNMTVPELEKMHHDLEEELRWKEEEEKYIAKDLEIGAANPDVSKIEMYRDDHEAWKAERERMLTPEPGEEHPKQVGMGRRRK